jgi:hypothetical protein
MTMPNGLDGQISTASVSLLEGVDLWNGKWLPQIIEDPERLKWASGYSPRLKISVT